MRASFPHPVVRVVIGLPLAAPAAGFTTLGLIGRGGLDTDSDPVRRTAQVQQVDLSADEAAMRARCQRAASGSMPAASRDGFRWLTALVSAPARSPWPLRG